MTYIPFKPEDVFPVGIMIPFGGLSLPSGWLWCQGQAVSRETYTELFIAIQTTYGEGDGENTFNLPDCRGRAIIGAGSGPGLSVRKSGELGGEETHILTIPEMPSHHHTALNQGLDTSGNTGFPKGMPPAGNTGNTGGDQPHNNMQPYIVVGGYIIKY